MCLCFIAYISKIAHRKSLNAQLQAVHLWNGVTALLLRWRSAKNKIQRSIGSLFSRYVLVNMYLLVSLSNFILHRSLRKLWLALPSMTTRTRWLKTWKLHGWPFLVPSLHLRAARRARPLYEMQCNLYLGIMHSLPFFFRRQARGQSFLLRSAICNALSQKWWRSSMPQSRRKRQVRRLASALSTSVVTNPI